MGKPTGFKETRREMPSRRPVELRVLDSGSKARVLEVSVDSQERIVVPRANVELIES